PGCKGTWDNIACWDRAEFGETVTIPCPRALKTIFGRTGNISRNCTAAGWSDVFPNISSMCGLDTSQEKQEGPAFDSRLVVFLHGVCMFSPCMCGFSPGNLRLPSTLQKHGC
ncbi:hypothetical protein AMECASPLE_026616, partial [Ameca splendens]